MNGASAGTQTQRTDRRMALVEAAFGAIATRGLEGLRLRDVAAEAGIDHSTLHHYFVSKQQLVLAVVEHATRQFWATMPTDGTHAQRLVGHLEALAALVVGRPALFTVLTELELRGLRDTAVYEHLKRQEAGWREALTEVVESPVAAEPPAAERAHSATVELVIAAVKGVRLAPDRASIVLEQLGRLIASGPGDGTD